MTTVLEKIVAGFPYPTVDSIHRHPNYDSISNLHQKLHANVTSVYSALGGGTHGHLVLTVPPAVCNTLSATPFVEPSDPSQNPVIPPLSTGPQIASFRLIHDKDTKAFTQYHNTDNALKQQVIERILP